MTAEEIVRLLAAANPDYEPEDTYHVCVFCDAGLPLASLDHEPDCVWRLAVEWVELEESEETA